MDTARFEEALSRAREWLSRRPLGHRAEGLERKLRELLEEYHAEAPRYLSRILVTIGARTVPVETAVIDWIGARDYCAELHAGGKSYVVRESLTALEAGLDPALFARVHRSAIVNLSRIVELRRGAVRGTSVILADGTRIPVSRSRGARLPGLLGDGR